VQGSFVGRGRSRDHGGKGPNWGNELTRNDLHSGGGEGNVKVEPQKRDAVIGPKRGHWSAFEKGKIVGEMLRRETPKPDDWQKRKNQEYSPESPQKKKKNTTKR